MLLTRRGALRALSVATLTALTACGRDAGAADPNASSDLVGEIRGAGATSQSDAQDAWMTCAPPSTTPAAAPGPGAPSSSRVPSTSPAPTPP